MRYPLGAGADDTSPNTVLGIWVYEARRLFRDRLVGEKAQDQFDSILNKAMRSDWSIDLNSMEKEGDAMYVTWGSTIAQDPITARFGKPIGRLSNTDMQEFVAKAIVGYGKRYFIFYGPV